VTKRGSITAPKTMTEIVEKRKTGGKGTSKRKKKSGSGGSTRGKRRWENGVVLVLVLKRRDTSQKKRWDQGILGREKGNCVFSAQKKKQRKRGARERGERKETRGGGPKSKIIKTLRFKGTNEWSGKKTHHDGEQQNKSMRYARKGTRVAHQKLTYRKDADCRAEPFRA